MEEIKLMLLLKHHLIGHLAQDRCWCYTTIVFAAAVAGIIEWCCWLHYDVGYMLVVAATTACCCCC